jgi:hypothetical protein
MPIATSLSSDAATFVQYEPNEMTLQIDAREKALLVLGEAWYPGWRAEVDGKTAPVVPVNGWMRGVPVPGGQHHVRLFYRQNYLLVGFVISAACGACLLLTILRAPSPRIDESHDGIGAVSLDERPRQEPADESDRAGDRILPRSGRRIHPGAGNSRD